MNIVHVNVPLAAVELRAPELRALTPSQDNYQVLLWQPEGYVVATTERIGHVDQATASLQCRDFLELAASRGTDLAVTPEYSTPWATVEEAITGGSVPAVGALWVLGCESISIVELIATKSRLSDHALVLFEDLPNDSSRLVNPLVYVFRAPTLTNSEEHRLVVLVQFKTCAMGDADHLETNLLHLGEAVYQFGDVGTSVRLLSLICSDAFEFLDAHAQTLYDRTLLIHIQLNAKPRQDQFRQYRSKFLGFQGDATEILCLNWAHNVHQDKDGTKTCWNNIGGSAWYLKSDDFDSRDETILANHRRGFYYTWSPRLRSHALFFNYNPSVFILTATKVFHLAVTGSLSRRRGPQVNEVLAWSGTSQQWSVMADVEDGFAALAQHCGTAKAEVERLAQINPLIAERVLALSVGMNTHHEEWYKPTQLDSCTIDDAEVIRRLTFCQDTDPGASAFRSARMLQFSRMWTVLTSGTAVPASFKDLTPRLDWNSASPHQNVLFSNNARGTAIYLGENATDKLVNAVAQKTAEHLRRSASSEDEGILARQHFALWYRNASGDIELHDKNRYVRFDETRDTSEFDFTRRS